MKARVTLRNYYVAGNIPVRVREKSITLIPESKEEKVLLGMFKSYDSEGRIVERVSSIMQDKEGVLLVEFSN